MNDESEIYFLNVVLGGKRSVCGEGGGGGVRIRIAIDV